MVRLIAKAQNAGHLIVVLPLRVNMASTIPKLDLAKEVTVVELLRKTLLDVVDTYRMVRINVLRPDRMGEVPRLVLIVHDRIVEARSHAQVMAGEGGDSRSSVYASPFRNLFQLCWISRIAFRIFDVEGVFHAPRAIWRIQLTLGRCG